MSHVRHDSRNKVGIDWYTTEAEADAAAIPAIELAKRKLAQGYDFGYLAIGRSPAFDVKDDDGATIEFAVVVP